MKMCSLIPTEPFYDCEENWIIVWTDDLLTIQAPNHRYYSGFAYHTITEKTYDDINVCNFFPKTIEFSPKDCWDKWLAIGNAKIDSCWDNKCLPLLWHELKHLECSCNWHEDMVSNKTMRFERMT